MLARSLRARRVQSYVPEIRRGVGELELLPKKIAEVFRSHFYDITDASGPHSTDSLRNRIEAYLDEAAPIRLPEQAIEEVDTLVTLEEWEDTLKNTQKGKAPGPDGISMSYYKMFSFSFQS